MDTRTRKASWKDRLSSVSKVFGVSGSPTRQYPPERTKESDRAYCEREGDRKNGNSNVRNGRGERSDADEDWCILGVSGSDIISFDTPTVFGSDKTVTSTAVEEVDGVVLYTKSEELLEMERGSEQTDGFLDRFRSTRKGEKVDGGGKNNTNYIPTPSPPASSGGVGMRKSSFGSRLKPEGAKFTRPGSPQPLQRRSSGRGKSKLDAHNDHLHHPSHASANGNASPRSTSPSRSGRRKPSTGSNPPSRNESPNLAETRKQQQLHQDVHTGLLVKQTQNGKMGRGSPAGSPSPGESAFSKVRDTLKISKAKKKTRKKKSAAYSVDPVEINFPANAKYQDPFEAPPSYTDSLEVTASKAQGHDFRPVSIPHNKPEYCDHCGETAWGLYRQVLKCSICDFIVHRKSCEARVNIDCSSKLERAVLQRDQLIEEHTTATEEEDNEREKKMADTTTRIPPATESLQEPSPSTMSPPASSPSSSISISHHHSNPQVLSEKAKLAKKIREYNRKTTPVNHIHIKGAHNQRDGVIEYVGFVRVHMCVQRPIHVSTAITRTSWYRLMRPVKERSEDAGLETAFYLPTDTNRLVHITNSTTTKELVQILLKKFCVTDNPKKFSLYEEYGGDWRRLFEEDNPLEISLEASVTNRNSKLVLRDNTYSTIQWDAFTPPELNNFILILRREEELYIEKLEDRFKLWKECVGQAMKEKCKEEISRQTYLGSGSRNGAKTSTPLLNSRTMA